MHHAEYQARPEARSFDWKDAGRLLGPVSQTARRYEVPGSTSIIRQRQHSSFRHAEDTTKVGRNTTFTMELKKK